MNLATINVCYLLLADDTIIFCERSVYSFIVRGSVGLEGKLGKELFDAGGSG